VVNEMIMKCEKSMKNSLGRGFCCRGYALIGEGRNLIREVGSKSKLRVGLGREGLALGPVLKAGEEVRRQKYHWKYSQSTHNYKYVIFTLTFSFSEVVNVLSTFFSFFSWTLFAT
jgi:hypothetical protein